jgi:predicted DNA-binding transcriptional regulator AlpA
MSLEHSPARQWRAAYSIASFCAAHEISRSKFYQMINEGIGPRLMKVGAKVLISAEAAADWRAEREAATTAGQAA